MGYRLCTAEKPSVARDIARVLGADERKDGYYQGNGCLVTWAVGHLVQLAEPERYGYLSIKEIWSDENREKALSELPFFPEKFILEVKPAVKKQFEIMKNLFHRDDVDLVIDCGDMGPEGHILQWLIREAAGCSKPVKRFCATSLTDEAIKKAFSDLRQIEDFEPVINGEYCKKKADWIMGMSLSRAASLKYHAHVDVGRVQSPTLFFVVKRYLDHMNFIPHDYYTFSASLAPAAGSAASEAFVVSWQKDKEHLINNETVKDGEGRIIREDFARQIQSSISAGGTGAVTAYDKKDKIEERPQLYDITELQRDGNRIFGYTAADTLAAAQSLYEKHKILSYPRTDSRYITTDLVPYMSGRISMISTIPEFQEAALALLDQGLNIDGRIVNDKKVTDHTALLVTEKIQGFKLSALDDREKNILNLVIIRLLTSFSKPCRYAETKISVSMPGGFTFDALGRTVLQEGFKRTQKQLSKKILRNDGSEEDSDSAASGQNIPEDLHVGDLLSIQACSIQTGTTTPPALHTEATLLTAMENAGAKLENGSILKGRGIGTQATRSEIIKNLFDKGYIAGEKKGKKISLIPTKLGLNVIKALPKQLYSPKITADWETMIADIVSGKSTEDDFMKNFSSFIRTALDELNQMSTEGIDFSKENISLGGCPWCGNPVYAAKSKKDKNSENFFCSAKCGFFLNSENKLYKARTGRSLTEAKISKLLKNGSMKEKCISKTGREYPCIFHLIKTEKEGRAYAGFQIELP